MDKKSLFIIATITLITIIGWVVFNVIHARAKTEIPPETQKLIEPINPTFDQETIKSLP